MLFDVSKGNDRHLHALFLERFPAPIVSRWRAGRYIVYRYRRRPGPPRTPDLWGLADD